MLPVQKRKILQQLDRTFGKNLSPEREEFKMKVYRSLVGEYTQEDIENAEREFQEMKQKYMEEMIYDDCSPATESEVISGKLISSSYIDGIDVSITDSRSQLNPIDSGHKSP
jgi:hypothetical protein